MFVYQVAKAEKEQGGMTKEEAAKVVMQKILDQLKDGKFKDTVGDLLRNKDNQKILQDLMNEWKNKGGLRLGKEAELTPAQWEQILGKIGEMEGAGFIKKSENKEFLK